MPVSERWQMSNEVEGISPPGRKLSDGLISFKQIYETTDAGISFASIVPLHVYCYNLSLVSNMVRVEVPLTIYCP